MTRQEQWHERFWAAVTPHPRPDLFSEDEHLARVDLRERAPVEHPDDLDAAARENLARFLDRVAEAPRSSRPASDRPDRLLAEIWATGRALGLGRVRLARRFGVPPAVATRALERGAAIVERAITSRPGNTTGTPRSAAPTSPPRRSGP